MFDLNKINNLSIIQKEIITSKYKQFLVSSVAGSGKTTILINRFFWLHFIKKIPLEKFIIITFAKKAANNIKYRINKFIDKNKLKKIYLGTFHSIAYRIIKKFYLLNKKKFFLKIIDENNQLNLIKKIIKKDKNYLPEFSIYDILNYINITKELGENFTNIKNISKIDYLRNLFLKYKNICNKYNLLDFTELLLKANKLLLNNKFSEYYKKKFSNILIDEFQDINFLQYKLFKKLFINKDFLLVGDDDQCIYTWRGVVENNFIKLKKDIPSIKIYKLEQNYRSSYSIIKCANQLIKNNYNRIYKKIWTNNINKNIINIYKAKNQINEANYIYKKIIKIIIKFNIKTIAILYRNKFQSFVIKNKIYSNILFNKNNIFYYLKNNFIKIILKLLFFVINVNNNNFFLKIINLTEFKLSKNIIDNFIKENNNIKLNYNFSYWKLINKIIKKKKVYNNNDKKIIFFISYINNIIKNLNNKFLPKKILFIIKILKKKKKIKNITLKIIKLFMQQIVIFYNIYKKNKKFTFNYKKKTFFDIKLLLFFFNKINNIKINFLTIHCSKGLEFDKVFLIGMEQGLFPLYKYINNVLLLEEERRLAYVALTRAKQFLTLTWCSQRIFNKKIKLNYPSIFIYEIYNNFVHFINFKINNFIPKLKNNILYNKKIVFHNIFGKGYIINTIKIDNLKFYEIKFHNFGIKKVLTNYSKLTLIK